MTAPAQAKGLEGIVVAETRLSKVEGDIGKLTYCGYNIVDLVLKATYEEVVYLLWHGRLPNQSELADLKAEISANMALPAVVLAQMQDYPRNIHPMAALRTSVSLAGLFDPQAEDNSPAANRAKALRLTAQMPTLIAAWARVRDGKAPVAPKAGLSIAGNFLYMMSGEDPNPVAIEAIDKYLIMLADHGMNASTFTARVVTSTDADMYSAVVAAVGSLKGPKHGGANEVAMKTFFEVADSGLSPEAWFQREVKQGGRRIAGIGHRVYKAPDPRAEILRDYSRQLAEITGNSQWYDIANQLEQLALADPHFIERKLYANVDYYSAVVLYSVGIAVDMFTPLFALSRIAGWAAQVIEQWQDNRLIRPDANYIGEYDLPWTPIEQR